MACTIEPNLKAASYVSELWRLEFTRMARTKRDGIEYMRPPRPTEAAITSTKVRKCFKKYLSILQSLPFCWLRYVVILGENPVALFFTGAYSFIVRIKCSDCRFN